MKGLCPQTSPNGQLTYRIVEDSAQGLFNIKNHDNKADIYLVRTVEDITQAIWKVTLVSACVYFQFIMLSIWYICDV